VVENFATRIKSILARQRSTPIATAHMLSVMHKFKEDDDETTNET